MEGQGGIEGKGVCWAADFGSQGKQGEVSDQRSGGIGGVAIEYAVIGLRWMLEEWYGESRRKRWADRAHWHRCGFEGLVEEQRSEVGEMVGLMSLRQFEAEVK
jgi:hypothetical protein